jgi:hypothetical protein
MGTKLLWPIFLLSSVVASADEAGKVISTPVNCQSNVFSSIQKVCSLVDKLGASCTITADTCVRASQETFTGAMIELANVNDTRAWSGLGGLGAYYATSSVCLMRDLSEFPGKKITTSAAASTFLGNVTAEQEVGFLSFDKSNGVFTGYHRLKACGPAVGCIDAFTQTFKMTPVETNKKGSGKKAGQYDILSATGIDLAADGLAQGLKVSLPGIVVPTPVGDIEAKPEFRFARATGFVTAPFDGNFKSSAPDSALGIKNNKTYDIYGRTAGTEATNLMPASSVGVKNPQGWISQISLGSRDANPKIAPWKPAPGVEFPFRPDSNLKIARSNNEKIPNAYLGASVKATYSPINLIPKPIRDIGCSGVVRLCLDQLEVFAQPTIDVGYTGQIQFYQNEQSAWDGTMLPVTTRPVPDLRPLHIAQSKTGGITASSSAAARFALEAGLDFVIRLEINTFFTKIKKNLVNIHPRTTIAESITSEYSKPVIAGARSLSALQLVNKKPFQQYVTFKGQDLSSGPQDGGVPHIQACFKNPTASGALPPEPTYTPGDMTVLVDKMEYACNICLGWEDTPYKDNSGANQVVPGNLQTLFPASQASRPASARWSCKIIQQTGCFDMCRREANGQLVVTRTALEMLASGEVQGMPATCSRGK